MAPTPDRPAPVLVTSPSIRSGTTLLQRLLCSSPQAIIYGEEIGKDLDLQLQVLASRRMIYGQMQPRLADGLRRVLAGDANDWIIDLMPDVDAYVEAISTGALAGLSACARHADGLGRTTWGFKYPGWSPHLLPLMAALMPGLRVVYLVRDLADTARSAKAWGDFGGLPDLQAFCIHWAAHVRAMRAWSPGHAVLELSYAALVDQPALAFGRLGDFLGVRDMDPGVLAHRINTDEGAAAGEARRGYRPPAELTAQEMAWVDAARASLDTTGAPAR